VFYWSFVKKSFKNSWEDKRKEKALKQWKFIRTWQLCNRVVLFLQVYHWWYLGHRRYERSGEKKWSKEWRNQEVSYCQSCITGYVPRIVRHNWKSMWSLLSILYYGLQTRIVIIEWHAKRKLIAYLASRDLGSHHERTYPKK